MMRYRLSGGPADGMSGLYDGGVAVVIEVTIDGRKAHDVYEVDEEIEGELVFLHDPSKRIFSEERVITPQNTDDK